MNQTVAVTGATGFIGKYIIDNLLARGFHVRALTRTARAHVNDNLTWVRGSLEDTHSLSKLVAGASAVVHCAGQVRGHKEEIFTRCNVDGSLRLMQAAKESCFCQRFSVYLFAGGAPSRALLVRKFQTHRRTTADCNG
ncbi:putative epimerase [Escherichia coli]|nr:putative epimerase [Escherichia coli]